MIKLYSQNWCPMCQLMKEQLDNSTFEYETISDRRSLARNGISTVPMIELEDGTMLNAKDAFAYIKGRDNGVR